ncbi:MAG: hydroxyacylglutathione hydrolase [Alphaproteobacteria bacterium]|nr:hydroxyacylglutathione hydrolase [Alphaproteobacteria bacterium]
MSFTIELLPAFADNYIFLVSDRDLGLAMVVDPGDGDVVSRALKERDLFLSLILNTHHHSDHSGGNEKLQREFGAPVIGPAKEQSRIPGLSRGVAHGDVVTFSTLRAEVLGTHGHTGGHVSYYFPKLKALFCGDTLFSLGCGRLFEGSAADMWDSLKLLRALPDDTFVYCAHEYTENNAKFALAIDKNNEALKKRAAEITVLRSAGKPTIPAILSSEKTCNPFLRADDHALRRALAKSGGIAEDADAGAVFGMMRSAKDRFGGQKL